MFERFTNGAREAVVAAEDEARRLGHGYIGTEHLLIAVLDQRESIGGRLLAERGLTVERVRNEVRLVVGPGPIDPEALAAIGIDLDEVRRRVEEVFGAGALEPERRHCGHVPFTPRSKKALEQALRAAVDLDAKAIEADHVLLGVLAVAEGLGAKVVERAGLSPVAVRNEVAGLLRATDG